jgi:hypothetical protein
MNLLMQTARAYVYAGNWAADCPASCGNVELLHEAAVRGGALTRKKTTFHCSYCNFETQAIEWPPNEHDITAVLDRRPIPHTRNWYPAEHPAALRFRIPHGQSVQDLVDENIENGVH